MDENSLTGYGLILHVATSTTIQAGSRTIHASSSEEAEALTLLEAARWATSMDCKFFWIEGDCKGVIDFAQGQANTIQWRNQAIIYEAMRILKSCESFLGFTFNHRSVNKVADVLAKQARTQGTHKQQSGQMPSFIQPALDYDFKFLISNAMCAQTEDNNLLVGSRISVCTNEIRAANSSTSLL
ncbi:uncharacterized protein LOC113312069 [Papaver somniferum]|uniref:uncharacterized protein LOC113312069 n=1 Tax=Papaver somniferum TaxID=3469 RepID=UPI000E6FFE0C|nr:uncharacterized protein LOC113312069 [Papaver somniferum]